MASAERRKKVGRIFVLTNLAAAIAVGVIVFATKGVNIPAIIDAIRQMTRIGFLWFILAMAARPLHDLLNTPWTAWLLANRRYLGLSFASWHLLHWITLPMLAHEMGGFTNFANMLGDTMWKAGSVLILITLMAATSFDAAQRWHGGTPWKVLHFIGLYAIWGWFLRVYYVHLDSPVKAPYMYVYIGLLYAVLGFRWIMTARRLWRRRLRAAAA